MKSYSTEQYVLLFLFIALFFTACTQPPSALPTTTPVIRTTPAAPETAALDNADSTNEPPSKSDESVEGDAGLVTTVQQADAAIFRVVTRGSFMAPQGVLLNQPGKGAGFIIDPSGLAVTNNHVVTGSTFIEVLLNGEGTPRQAEVIAVSECSNLALIDIEGEDFPYFNWYQGEINAGTEVWLVGFSLFTVEYTITKGVISKEKAIGESSWASIAHAVEFDTQIVSENSGGPVFNSDGEIVAVTYPSSPESDDQAYGVGSEIAQDIVSQLREGSEIDAIGINGQALAKEDGTMFGVWVSGVEVGSHADRARIKPGDWIRKMENVELASDGTMLAYCELLRGRSPNDALSVEVWRLSTGEVLRGQINGRELETIGSLTTTASGALTASYSLIPFVDDTGALSIKLPADWELLNGSPATNDNNQPIAARIQAFPKIGMRLGNFSPGVLVRASSHDSILLEDLLNQLTKQGYESCIDNGRSSYANFGYAGLMHSFSECGDTKSSVFLLALQRSEDDLFESEPVVIYRVQGYDKAFVDTVLSTLRIDSEGLP